MSNILPVLMGSVKDVLHSINYGMYVVSSKKGDKINGQVVNTVFQITPVPVTIATSINKDNLTHEFINSSGVFTVSILSKDAPFKLIGLFGFRSGRDVDKFSQVDYGIGDNGAPYLREHAVAYLEAKVIKKEELFTHTIFIGEVIGGKMLTGGEPMTYDYYHNDIKGKTPKNAATYSGGGL